METANVNLKNWKSLIKPGKLDINLNDDLNLNDLDQILKKIYQSNFFDNVNVSLNNNILSIEVDEKPIIETIRYDGV